MAMKAETTRRPLLPACARTLGMKCTRRSCQAAFFERLAKSRFDAFPGILRFTRPKPLRASLRKIQNVSAANGPMSALMSMPVQTSLDMPKQNSPSERHLVISRLTSLVLSGRPQRLCWWRIDRGFGADVLGHKINVPSIAGRFADPRIFRMSTPQRQGISLLLANIFLH
ncbi:hypothetical protein [Bradyrhizobium sp. USDA 4486]